MTMYAFLYDLCCLVAFNDTVDDILKTALEEHMVTPAEWAMLVDEIDRPELHEWAKSLLHE